MTRHHHIDPLADVAATQGKLDRLLERRERALEGAGRAPDPEVIRAAEEALERARERMRKALAV